MRILAILLLALAHGCAVGVEEAPPSVVVEAPPLLVQTNEVAKEEVKEVAKEEAKEEVKEEAAPAPPFKSESAKVVPPPAKAPAKVPASPLLVEQLPTKEGPPVVLTAAAPLDVASLKARLRDTKAIGVLTKLTLRNQMDDLVGQFRAHHQSGQKTSVASLRPPYDSLVLKVLTVIKDGDPALARTIAESREAIWDILADPDKFASAQGEAS